MAQTNYRVTVDLKAENDDEAKKLATKAAQAVSGKVAGIQAEKLAFRSID